MFRGWLAKRIISDKDIESSTKYCKLSKEKNTIQRDKTGLQREVIQLEDTIKDYQHIHLMIRNLVKKHLELKTYDRPMEEIDILKESPDLVYDVGELEKLLKDKNNSIRLKRKQIKKEKEYNQKLEKQLSEECAPKEIVSLLWEYLPGARILLDTDFTITGFTPECSEKYFNDSIVKGIDYRNLVSAEDQEQYETEIKKLDEGSELTKIIKIKRGKKKELQVNTITTPIYQVGKINAYAILLETDSIIQRFTRGLFGNKNNSEE